MKLILASDYTFLLKYGYNLTGIPKDKMRIGHIITATKGTGKSFNPKYKMIIEENGYQLDSFDIENKSEGEIRNFLKDKNIIQMEGGNTFYLLKIIRETGFDGILKDLINEGKVYIGTSAGSYVMCPSIVVAVWNHDAVAVDRCGVTDFTALNYVPFVLRVHYKDEMREEVKERRKTLKYPLRILRDGQGILVEDNKYTFMGDGEEVKL